MMHSAMAVATTFVLFFSVTRGTEACDASSLITAHEGKRLCVYTDTTGHKTIGVGYNLDQTSARSDISKIGGDFDDLYSGKKCLTDAQCSALLKISLSRAEAAAAADVSSYDSLCCDVKNVMTDLAFNLGQAGLGEFKTFISLIDEGSWSAAASDLKGTLWCSQVGNRCPDDCERISSGCGGPSPSPPAPSPGPSPSSSCCSCISGGGGMACADRCDAEGSTCTSCVKNGGGKACGARCGCDERTTPHDMLFNHSHSLLRKRVSIIDVLADVKDRPCAGVCKMPCCPVKERHFVCDKNACCPPETPVTCPGNTCCYPGHTCVAGGYCSSASGELHEASKPYGAFA